MKIYKKIGLFLSSFTPLFLLLILKIIIEIINKNWTFNFLNCFMLIILILTMIYGVLSLLNIVNQSKINTKKTIFIIKKKNKTDEHFLGYFSLFVLFAVSFEIEMYSMAIIFFVVLFLIGIVYIKNDMYYINPLLNIFGYSFYEITCSDGSRKYITYAFYKGLLKENTKYLINDKYSNMIFIVDLKK